MVRDNHFIFIQKKQPRGFVAMVALLIVASVGLTFGIAANMVGFDELRAALDGTRVAQARGWTNACVEDGLERLRRNFSSSNFTLSNETGSCIIQVSVNGAQATLHATGTVDIYFQKTEVIVDNSLEIINWREE